MLSPLCNQVNEFIEQNQNEISTNSQMDNFQSNDNKKKRHEVYKKGGQ